VQHLAPLAKFANHTSRQPAPISELVLGMECGGSNAYSGFTANPGLGVASGRASKSEGGGLWQL